MATGHDMVVRMLADSKQYLSEMRKMQAETRKARSLVGESASFIKHAFASMTGFLGRDVIVGTIRGIVGGMQAIVGAGWEMATSLEDTTLQFEVMTGSAQTARDLMKQLYTYAAKTPFQFQETFNAAQILMASGMDAKQILPWLKALGDLSNRGNRSLPQVAEIYAKIASNVKLTGEELRQLHRMGLPFKGALANVMGVRAEDISQLAEEGKIGIGEFQRAIENMVGRGGLFSGMTERLSQTLSGVWSTLKDSFDMVSGQLVQSLAEIFDIKSWAKWGTQLGDWLVQVIKDWTPKIKAWWEYVRDEGIRVLNEFGAKFIEWIVEAVKGVKTFVSMIEGVLAKFDASLTRVESILGIFSSGPGRFGTGISKGDASQYAGIPLEGPEGYVATGPGGLGVPPGAEWAQAPEFKPKREAWEENLLGIAAAMRENAKAGRLFPELPKPAFQYEDPMGWVREFAPRTVPKKEKESGKQADIFARAVGGGAAWEAIHAALKSQRGDGVEHKLDEANKRLGDVKEAVQKTPEEIAFWIQMGSQRAMEEFLTGAYGL